MIQLNLTEQELFDTIMSVYLASNCPDETKAQAHESNTAERRKALLEKLHEAFESAQEATRQSEAVA